MKLELLVLGALCATMVSGVPTPAGEQLPSFEQSKNDKKLALTGSSVGKSAENARYAMGLPPTDPAKSAKNAASLKSGANKWRQPGAGSSTQPKAGSSKKV